MENGDTYALLFVAPSPQPNPPSHVIGTRCPGPSCTSPSPPLTFKACDRHTLFLSPLFESPFPPHFCVSGVKELFEKPSVLSKKRNRYELFRRIDMDYYGYRDEEDGILAPLEEKAEAQALQEAEEEWETVRRAKEEAKRRVASGEEASVRNKAEGEEEGGPAAGGEEEAARGGEAGAAQGMGGKGRRGWGWGRGLGSGSLWPTCLCRMLRRLSVWFWRRKGGAAEQVRQRGPGQGRGRGQEAAQHPELNTYSAVPYCTLSSKNRRRSCSTSRGEGKQCSTVHYC